jgi:alanine racemase
MDQIMVDVTDLNALDAGEEVVLIGRQGSGEISAAEVAQKAGTIAWEIFTGISSRVERVYLT